MWVTLKNPNLAVLAFVTLLAFGCSEEQPKSTQDIVRPVRALKIDDHVEFRRREFTGRAKASKELDLAFNVPGQIVLYDVKIGDVLQKGDLIAKLDPAPYQAEVDRAKAALRRSNATLSNAIEQVKRDETLFKKGHISKARLDRTQSRFNEIAADVAAAKANLNKANLDLKYAALGAPFGGIVVQRYVENFENVQSKQAVIRLVDSTQVEMIVDVPENLISYAPQAQDIKVVFDAFPHKEIPAEIKEIGTEASASTRTYPVTLVMNQPADATILPGMAGRAYSTGEPPKEIARQSGIEIPATAVFTEGTSQSSYVWTIDKDKMTVQQRQIEPGNLTDRGVSVKSGLQSGDWIVTAGVHFLKEGQKIKLLQP